MEEKPVRVAENIEDLERFSQEAKEHLLENPQHYVVMGRCSTIADDKKLDEIAGAVAGEILPLKPPTNLRLVQNSRSPQRRPTGEDFRVHYDSSVHDKPPTDPAA